MTMFTFLPREQRSRVAREYKKRLLSLYVAVLTFVGIVWIVSLVPSLILVKAHRDAAMIERGAIRDSAISKGADDTERLVKETGAKLASLGPLSGEKALSSAVAELLTHVSGDVRISSISVRRGNPSTTGISGIAATREALVAFSKSLQGDAFFQKVELPVSTLAKSKDISFSLNLEYKFK
ncbi:MAG: PilN domain-containing protein [Candidatus Paceibacterota bacterium]|jgi:Tfp pilus assembly protein PilN